MPEAHLPGLPVPVSRAFLSVPNTFTPTTAHRLSLAAPMRFCLPRNHSASAVVNETVSRLYYPARSSVYLRFAGSVAAAHARLDFLARVLPRVGFAICHLAHLLLLTGLPALTARSSQAKLYRTGPRSAASTGTASSPESPRRTPTSRAVALHVNPDSHPLSRL